MQVLLCWGLALEPVPQTLVIDYHARFETTTCSGIVQGPAEAILVM